MIIDNSSKPIKSRIESVTPGKKKVKKLQGLLLQSQGAR